MPLAPTIEEWFAANARDLPWRRPNATPWAILVSEVMLQQTPVARVEPAYRAWLERWPGPVELADDSPGEAVRMWGKLGYPRRALRLHACAVGLRDRFAGEVPDDVEALLTLPGIGDYTARAVACFAFGQRHAVVDTNVRRVVARVVNGVGDPGPPSTRRDLAATAALLPVDAVRASVVSAGLMELGALVCTARTPHCDGCPVALMCQWRLEGYPAYSGPARARQRFAGTDRQVRGRLLDVLRGAAHPVSSAELDLAWPLAAQRARALDSLVSDGLIDPLPDGRFALPA